MPLEHELMSAHARGVAPPQNWTTRAAAELAALRKDAERYRWLRDAATGGDWETIGQGTDPGSTDAAIDAAMAAEVKT